MFTRSLTLATLFTGCLIGAHPAAAAQSSDAPSCTLRLLFIGNSYTYANSLTTILMGMASRAHDRTSSFCTIEADSIAKPSYTLEQHWNSGAVQSKLKDNKYDYVVLQEHAARPLLQPERFEEYALKFNDLIRAHHAKPILFETWANQSQPDKQPLLYKEYVSLARKMGAQLSPCGESWKSTFTSDSAAKLYIADGRHASFSGGYACAASFYTLLFRQKPLQPSAEEANILNSDKTSAPELHQAAHQAVGKMAPDVRGW
ncbi:hypothetical protein GCM10009425_32140 [Pseudomonas asuensis]|uniref:SGNH/GDSL hydrolase family protein n=1 Tax=Pseudomonas asuensis TaxID=1825787 RepID=A0ABQ2GYQ1_9PSED|nr:hypothetical protein [Pseudomonas asuensis]GGM18834.1 hypothetical protein GCM10009425_32140 [Pseudomonas asuensis]